jgi:hypothetical protein
MWPLPFRIKTTPTFALFKAGVLYYVVSDRLIDNIDAFVAGSPRDVVTA